MAFPQTPLPVVVELNLAGVWTDITEHVYTRDPISIKRGRSNEGSRVQPSACTLTLNNADGRFSPRNPRSPLFGLIGRNTPIRVSVGADVRFSGEVAAWPQQWDKPGKDVWTPVEAAGVMRRLGQGRAVVSSVLVPYLVGTNPVAYWPLEDGPGTIAGVPAVGKSVFSLFGKASPQSWGQGNIGPWLPPVIRRLDAPAGTMQCFVDMPGFAGTWTVDYVRSGGGGTFTGFGVFGTVNDLNTVTSLSFDGANNEVFITPSSGSADNIGPVSLPDVFDDNPHHIRFTATQDGADIDYQAFVDGVLVLSGTKTSLTLARVTQITFNASAGASPPYAHGHVAVWTSPPTLSITAAVALGMLGERAGRRIERICSEKGIPFTAVGNLDDTTPLGQQGAGNPLELLAECADADHGILYEPRATLGLAYRTRMSLYNQTAALDLDYSDSVFAGLPEPVDDDQNTRNDVTAKRPDSGQARVFLAAGPLSVQDPPAGVGTYDHEAIMNVFADGILADHASWLLALGTVDEARYPRLIFGLHTPPVIGDPALAAALAALEQGDLMRVTGLPPWLPPDAPAALAVGMTETLAPFSRDLEVTTVPASVYTVGVYASAADPAGSKYDTDGSQLASAIPATGSFSVSTTRGPLWTVDDAEDGFDIYVGGERMTVTDIGAPSGSIQQFTVIRSVNGVVKGHPIGTPVRLWQPARIAL
ncbi:MAG: hypothetical protein ACREF4_08500 [Gammaproteobacteria bacterium]